jgi:hypothetical protein
MITYRAGRWQSISSDSTSFISRTISTSRGGIPQRACNRARRLRDRPPRSNRLRGSSKTVCGSLITPLWLALECPQTVRFIIPVANTLSQSTANIANIKYELESNTLFLQDYGKFDIFNTVESAPTFESEEEWQKQNLLISNGVRILARTTGPEDPGTAPPPVSPPLRDR